MKIFTKANEVLAERTFLLNTRRFIAHDLLGAIKDLLIPFLITFIIFATLTARIQIGTDYALKNMPSMLADGAAWAYSISQAFGFSALIWAWLSIFFGLTVSSGFWRKKKYLRIYTETLHRRIGINLIVLTLFHAVFLIWSAMGDTLLTVFIPFNYSDHENKIYVAFGVFSFYGMIATSLIFYFRKKLGHRAWIFSHRFLAPIVYILGVWHTIAYGSDSFLYGTVSLVIIISQFPLIILLSRRFFSYEKME
ncbi:ferric reductase-like transmembrane domain-containing protein [Erwinia rhapontici]|uniref:ferric reductase-like transmembrane domain-containing protein n=1 Tax=Erwinia rhapontici TaxID=55212 RepID=UPI003BA03806